MEPISLVPKYEVCAWLLENGWSKKTEFQYRKYSLNEKPLLVSFPTEPLELLIASGELQHTYFAPTVRELFDALPTNVVVDRTSDGDYYVGLLPFENQGIFKIEKRLEDALAYLWLTYTKETKNV